MPNSCVAYNCTNRVLRASGILFYKFPTCPDLKKLWVHAVRRQNWMPSVDSKLCSQHFKATCFNVFGDRKYLKETAVPTIFNFPAHLMKTTKPRSTTKKRNHSPDVIPASTKRQRTCREVGSKDQEYHVGKHCLGTTENIEATDLVQASIQENCSTSREDVSSVTPPTTSTIDKCPENASVLESHEMNTISENSLAPCHSEPQNSKNLKHKNLDHDYCLPSPRKIYKQLCAYRERNKILTKKVKVTKMKSKRQIKKLKNLQDALTGLRKHLSESDSIILSEVFGDVIKELITSKKSLAYSDEVKKFATTLQFYSDKAYRYIRKYLPLPHPSTIRNWASKLDGGPGFTQQCFGYLASLPEPKNVCLVMDEMAIKHQIDFDGKQSVGFCDLGHGVLEHDNVPEAREALVFMVVAMNGSWKLPIGYSLVNGLNHSVKTNLVIQYIKKLYSVGVTCVAVTFDGAPTNIAMMKELGIELDDSGVPKNCFFQHPCEKNLKVRCFLDISHMLKLIRNLLGEYKILIYDSVQGPKPIDWKYFTMLHELQSEEGMHAANKFGRQHIEWQRQKMKVKLAAQTFSLAVSSAFKFLEKLLPEFSGVTATAEFCEVINNCFDLLNSCHPLASYSKSHISKNNREHVCSVITSTVDYLKRICDGSYIPVLNGRRKTAVLGMILDLMSVQSIAEEYVWQESSHMKYLLPRKFSQDHLELFFATIRSRGGNNNNPSALQFRSAYRRTLLASITPPSSGNCAADDTHTPLVHSFITDVTQNVAHNIFAVEKDHNYAAYVGEFKQISEYSDQVVVYIAGWVARKLQKVLTCQLCINIAVDADSQEEHSLLAIKNRGGLVHASADVVNTCLIAEKVLRVSCLLHKLTPQKNILLQLTVKAANILSGKKYFRHHEHLFTASEFGAESHYSILTKYVIKLYLQTRLRHVAKLHSSLQQGQSVRQMYTKLILFKGQ